MYGPCPHIGGWKFGGIAPNARDILLVCPVGTHSPFPPGCEFQMEFIGQFWFLSGFLSFSHGLSFSLLPVVVADAEASVIVIAVTMVMIFMASEIIDIIVDIQLWFWT